MPKKEKINRLLVRKLTSDLLKKIKCTEAPVMLGDLLSFLDYDLEPADPQRLNLKKISGFTDLDYKIIIFNDTHPKVRQRFTIAHEIGHIMLKHSVKDHIYNINSQDPIEIEANMFAVELLMPYKWFKSDNLLTVDQLSRKYWVSREAAGWRLAGSDSLLR